MSVELKWKHQQETYQAMKEQLKKTHKAAFIYPTSGGKTFPPLKILEENQDKRAILLAPTREILEQDKEYIQKYIMESTEPVKSRFRNWHFITYQGLSRFNIKNAKVDMIIADELHRVGAPKWGKDFDTLLENNAEADKIAMTATPERTDGRNMMDEYFKDDVVYELTAMDALSGDKTGEAVLKPSRYVRVISEMKPVLNRYREKLDRLPAGNEKNTLLKRFEKLEETLKVADSLEDTFAKSMKNKSGKYIIFCKDEADMKESMEKAKEWFAKVNPEMHMDYVFSGSQNSEMRKTDKQNRQTMNEFKRPSMENQNKLKLLFCVDKLNEGVHVDGISGVVMLRPTESPGLYEQQRGRGFITADKDQEETVIIDVANNWLRFYERYKEYVECIQRGKNKREASKIEKEKKNYESYDFTGEELELLDLLREIDKVKERSSVAETLRVAQILKDNGVDLSKIQLSKRMNGTMYNFLLSEIQQEGVDIAEIIKENELDGEFDYGRKVKELVGAYNGTNRDIPIMEDEKRKAEELGLVNRNKNKILETLRIATILKNNGINLRNLQLSERNGKKKHYYLLSEIEQEGVDIAKIIKVNNLDEKFEYRNRIAYLKTLYNQGKLEDKIREEMEDLGLVDKEKDERHPYIKLIEEVRNWQQENQTDQLPKQKRNSNTKEGEYECRLASKIQNLKLFIKNKKGKELSDEEKKIFREADELGITDKVKHPYKALLEKIQKWQIENKTQEFPKARMQERNLPPEERSEEYNLGKKLENLQNSFLKKYKKLTDEEFLDLPKDIQEIIAMCAQMGIGNQKNEIIQRMRGYITENIESNSEVRAELMQRVKEFNGEMDKGENKQ